MYDCILIGAGHNALVGGFYAYEVPTGAQVVSRVRAAVDSTVWVVDSGDSEQARGQIIQLTIPGTVLVQLR